MKNCNDYHTETTDANSLDTYFGIVCSVFFFAVSLLPLLKGDRIRLWTIFIGIIFLLLSFLLPAALTPLRKAWIRIGFLLQKITEPLILGIVFYGFFAPIGVIMRWVGKDPLNMKKRYGETNNWRLRNCDSTTSNMKNQF